ncbi:beta-Ala-His dipeptidase isoform X2 [Papio anubis]|uniref:beta-Ala-His dipeptidase isoform X2 n=1 Tax=Papio anubis TaxID=9555 RepID=UPI0012AE65F1|nr:beta-Ala-His dipeptidase isoform X2 [Papio anubis]
MGLVFFCLILILSYLVFFNLLFLLITKYDLLAETNTHFLNVSAALQMIKIEISMTFRRNPWISSLRAQWFSLDVQIRALEQRQGYRFEEVGPLFPASRGHCWWTQDLPVNIKFIIEGMEEAGSVALEELVEKEKNRFFSGVDYIVISDNLWISQRKPAITYGTRGNSYFTVEVKCRDQDFHSGTFGGILHEPMADLVALLGSLVDSSGHILVPGIYDEVAPLTEEEINTYKAIHLDLEEYRNSSRVEKFLFDTKEEILMHLWRYPSLSIHGIEGAFDEPGAKTVIPGQVIGKFSIRLVPHMNVSVVEKQVTQHLEDVFSKRNSSNKMVVSMTLGLHPWIANINDTQYLAAKRAIRTVFGTEPDMIRDGSTIPIAKMFQEIVHKSVVLIPLGAVDDGEHSQNEKINRWNYIEGTKLFAAFFLEMAQLH